MTADSVEFLTLFQELRELRQVLAAMEAERVDLLAELRPEARASARNLLHYLVLRSHDLREIQERLTRCGLSSLGRSESHVLWTLESVLGVLRRLHEREPGREPRDAVNPSDAAALLEARTDTLFGPPPGERTVRIMVTMPTEAAEDPAFTRDLLAAGMDCMRINCAHDGPAIWQAMIGHLRAGQEATGRRCRVLMDLPGPRVRTGTVPPCPGAVADPTNARAPSLLLHRGDTLLLTRDPAGGRHPGTDPANGTVLPARVPCLPAEVLDAVVPGDRIWFDDGKIGGVIRGVGQEATVEITAGRAKGEKLRSEKGINLPDTVLPLPSLTEQDRALLPFVVEHTDLVGYSFVRSAGDVRTLREALAALGGEELGVLLKIETVHSFQQLPAMMLEGLAGGPFGVMIARGDLAVEGGFARMAEVQEEILWLTEAAHVPVVWATQVMEGLAKRGRPSRAEITDAAMGERAECVMLNKGPHIVDAVRALHSIFGRMRGHQKKKRSVLRRLEVAAGFTGIPEETPLSGGR